MIIYQDRLGTNISAFNPSGCVCVYDCNRRFRDTTAGWPECVPITFTSQLEPRTFTGSLKTKKTEGAVGLCIAFAWADPAGTTPQISPTPDAPFVMAPQRYNWCVCFALLCFASDLIFKCFALPRLNTNSISASIVIDNGASVSQGSDRSACGGEVGRGAGEADAAVLRGPDPCCCQRRSQPEGAAPTVSNLPSGAHRASLRSLLASLLASLCLHSYVYSSAVPCRSLD
jgi:hypothetical protein